MANSLEQQKHPKHCFCQIPEDELRVWADKRYNQHIDTMKLIQSTDDPHEKEVIGIVALLDVDEETLLSMMDNVDKPDHHIIHCRENVKHLISNG